MTTLGYAHHSLSVSTLTMTVIWKTSHLFSAKKQRDSVPQGGTQDCTRRKHLPPFSRERLSEDSFNSGGLLKYIFICSHLRHIFITSSSHLRIFSSSHLTSSHLHIFTSSLSLSPSFSLPLLIFRAKGAQKCDQKPRSREAEKPRSPTQAEKPRSREAAKYDTSREAEKPRSREAEKPRSREAEKPRSREAEKPRSREASREAEKPRSREAAKPRSRRASREAEKPRSREAEKPPGKPRSREAEKPRSREAEQYVAPDKPRSREATGQAETVALEPPLNTMLHLHHHKTSTPQPPLNNTLHLETSAPPPPLNICCIFEDQASDPL